MHLISAYLRAFALPYTYDPRNLFVWFGFLWGLPIPFFSLALHLSISGWQGRSLAGLVHAYPIHLVFLSAPFVFSLVFGAMGTVRHQLAEENRRLIEELRTLALTDPLTGIHNRRYVLEELQKALDRSERDGRPVCVVLFDMDNFKAVNERSGHLAGDRLLRDAAEGLRSVTRKSDSLGRYGGDEFLLVTEGDAASVETLVERASDAVLQKSSHSISAGIAEFPRDGSTPNQLIAAADRALAARKAAFRASRTRHDRPA